ncbi:MAG: hypothetical protein D6762_00060 [Candidatus Neomarinimicrobiota bacterium]|nr:MAG: hypothetical protein D6762_00060 [Candidatus Neomarinimicrobiota bacterium]
MVRLLLVVLFLSCGWAQSKTEAPPEENPCQTPLIMRASRQGLRSIPIRKLPQFWYQVWQCRKSGVGAAAFRKLDRRQLESDYTESHQFHGWTSTWSYCITSVLFFFYLEKFT